MKSMTQSTMLLRARRSEEDWVVTVYVVVCFFQILLCRLASVINCSAHSTVLFRKIIIAWSVLLHVYIHLPCRRLHLGYDITASLGRFWANQGSRNFLGSLSKSGNAIKPSRGSYKLSNGTQYSKKCIRCSFGALFEAVEWYWCNHSPSPASVGSLREPERPGSAWLSSWSAYTSWMELNVQKTQFWHILESYLVLQSNIGASIAPLRLP